MGADNVQQLLPPLLAAVVSEEHPVLWACDPMHGNTIRTADGTKTRRFDAVMTEIEGFFAACWAAGARPGGVHLEFTGMDVTECLGGADDVLESQLSSRYETLCDPRLNARQSLDLAFRARRADAARAALTPNSRTWFMRREPRSFRTTYEPSSRVQAVRRVLT